MTNHVINAAHNKLQNAQHYYDYDDYHHHYLCALMMRSFVEMDFQLIFILITNINCLFVKVIAGKEIYEYIYNDMYITYFVFIYLEIFIYLSI